MKKALALEEDNVATRPSEAAQVKNLDLLDIMNDKLDNLENETDDDLNLFYCNIIL